MAEPGFPLPDVDGRRPRGEADSADANSKAAEYCRLYQSEVDRVAELTRERDEARAFAADWQRTGARFPTPHEWNLVVGQRDEMRGLADAAVRLLERVLGGFFEKGHPGAPCRRSGWVDESTLAEWTAEVRSWRAEIHKPYEIAPSELADWERELLENEAGPRRDARCPSPLRSRSGSLVVGVGARGLTSLTT